MLTPIPHSLAHRSSSHRIQTSDIDPFSFPNDEIRYNRGYKWQPYKCTYKMYKPEEIKACVAGKTLVFTGDSLGR